MAYLKEEVTACQRSVPYSYAVSDKVLHCRRELIDLETEELRFLQHLVPLTASLGHVDNTLIRNVPQVSLEVNTLEVRVVHIVQLTD